MWINSLTRIQYQNIKLYNDILNIFKIILIVTRRCYESRSVHILPYVTLYIIDGIGGEIMISITNRNTKWRTTRITNWLIPTPRWFNGGSYAMTLIWTNPPSCLSMPKSTFWWDKCFVLGPTPSMPSPVELNSYSILIDDDEEEFYLLGWLMDE